MARAPGPKPPHEHARYRPRGAAHLLVITYPLIAAAAGLQPETVRRHASRKVFDPRDLASVTDYISRWRAKRRKAVAPSDPQ